jgi:hypothetical protein
MNASDSDIRLEGSVRRGRAELLLAGAASIALWYVPWLGYLVFPLKLFVTIVHEGCHGLATVLTGGVVQGIAIHPDGSGVTISDGGDAPIITMAGYLGAALCGALALQLVRRRNGGSLACAVIGGGMLGITLLWIRNGFGIAVGLLLSASILASLRLRPASVREFVGSFLCVQLCLNALFDLRDLVYLTTQTNAPNDAVFMSERVGLTPAFWAGLWAVLAVAILGVGLRQFWSRPR